MKNLQFHYHMEILFSQPVHSHIYTLKCLPVTTDTQQIKACEYTIYPAGKVQESYDSFGNRMLYGTEKGEHTRFQVDVTGRAVTGICDMDRQKEKTDISVYKYQTPLTKPQERIRRLFMDCRRQADFSKMPLEEKVRFYMETVQQHLTYHKGITTIYTTAEESLALGKGVCQDYAHVMLSLCREEKIPARYVVGMLMGEGESHAWVEVYDGAKWRGYDPTNNLEVGDLHIKISHGRDYSDCSINRGVFTGQAKQSQSIWAEVSEIQTEQAMGGIRQDDYDGGKGKPSGQ